MFFYVLLVSFWMFFCEWFFEWLFFEWVLISCEWFIREQFHIIRVVSPQNPIFRCDSSTNRITSNLIHFEWLFLGGGVHSNPNEWLLSDFFSRGGGQNLKKSEWRHSFMAPKTVKSIIQENIQNLESKIQDLSF